MNLLRRRGRVAAVNDEPAAGCSCTCLFDVSTNDDKLLSNTLYVGLFSCLTWLVVPFLVAFGANDDLIKKVGVLRLTQDKIKVVPKIPSDQVKHLLICRSWDPSFVPKLTSNEE